MMFLRGTWSRLVNIFPLYLLTILMVVSSLTYRVLHLNYNSAFNDEAIYVVVGRMGIFQADWLTYNANAWMAGSQYFYPVLTALAYMVGGLVGSRLLNVLFFVVMMGTLYLFIRALDVSRSLWVGAVFLLMLIANGVGIYVSMLATYDMPSYAFFFLGILLLWLPYRTADMFTVRRYLFLSGIFLCLAVYTKLIVALYLPLLVVWTFFLALSRGKDYMRSWGVYWLIWLVGGIAYYIISNLSGFGSFSQHQVAGSKASYSQIIWSFWHWSNWAWGFWLLGSIGLLSDRKYSAWISLTLAAVWVSIPHFLLQRFSTFDKHTFLTIIFLLIVGSWGSVILWFRYIANLLYWRGLVWGGALCIYLVYFFTNLSLAGEMMHQWRDASGSLAYLSAHVERGDQVLSEVGASTIMAVYDNTFPTNVNTFDWLDYQGEQGQHAYFRAVRDGHFKWIHLESNDHPKLESIYLIDKSIRNELSDNYILAYEDNGFEVYKRIF